MPILIHNTLTRRKEVFEPVVPGRVGIYHCGPTVYWTQHIGNLRGMFFGDIVTRTFRQQGIEAVHVCNYTDVGHLTSDEDEGEDKMEKGARRDGVTPLEIADRYIGVFERDKALLNIGEPSVKPRATGHIPEMIAMVETLIKEGYAYATDLAVYYDTTKFPSYYSLSGQKADEQITGAGRGDVSDPGKKHSADFVLWFFRAGNHKNALQYWRSPFASPLVAGGEGFPGWHIECSAMSKRYLGPTIDIHMGGIEHVPVHHTNEIAQSESANGAKYVNYWMHNEHLLVDGRKMSKSEGTGYTVSQIIERGFSPLALRYFFLQAHYRSKQNFTWEALEAASRGLAHLYRQAASIRQQASREPGGRKSRNMEQGEGDTDFSKQDLAEEYEKMFINAISDDFNTPQALAVAQEMLKSDLPAQDKLTLIGNYDMVLGLDLLVKCEPEQDELPERILDLVEARKKARTAKDWIESDRLRQEIATAGYGVEDTAEGMKVFKN